MKRNRILLAAVLFSFLTGCSRHAEQPAETKAGNQPAAQPRDVWVSETTGKEYRVQVDNNVVRTEWLNVNPELAKHGAFIRSQCKKEGAKWVGKSTSYVPCTTKGGPKPSFDNWCHLETDFEIDTMTPQSITGKSPGLINFDCMKCKILKSEMREFLWTPKEGAPK